MAQEKRIPVFLSWGGTAGKKIATEIRKFLWLVFDKYSDDEFIFFSPAMPAGTPGFNKLIESVRDSAICFLCLTKEAIESQYVMGEVVGILGSSSERNPIKPILFNATVEDLRGTPHEHLQAVDFDLDRIVGIVEDIYDVLQKTDSAIKNRGLAPFTARTTHLFSWLEAQIDIIISSSYGRARVAGKSAAAESELTDLDFLVLADIVGKGETVGIPEKELNTSPTGSILILQREGLIETRFTGSSNGGYAKYFFPTSAGINLMQNTPRLQRLDLLKDYMEKKGAEKP